MKSYVKNGKITADCEGHWDTDYSESRNAKIIPTGATSLSYTASVTKTGNNANIVIRYSNDNFNNRTWRQYTGFNVKFTDNNFEDNSVEYTIFEVNASGGKSGGKTFRVTCATTGDWTNQGELYVFTIYEKQNNTWVKITTKNARVNTSGGSSTREPAKAGVLSSLVQNNIYNVIYNDINVPQGGKKPIFWVNGSNNANAYVTNGAYDWNKFSNYLHNKLDNKFTLYSGAGRPTESLDIPGIYWTGCDQNQIYRSTISFYKEDNNKCSAKVTKKWLTINGFNIDSDNDNYNSSGCLEAAPYYCINGATWKFTGTNLNKTSTLSYSNNTYSIPTVTIDLGASTSKSVTATETYPGRGYRVKSTNPQTVTIYKDQTKAFEFTNELVLDPGNFTLQKVDTAGNAFSGSLAEGAIYQVVYLPLQPDGTTVGNATKTWYFKTDKNGKFGLLDDAYNGTINGTKYNSDSQFTQNGAKGLPVGDYRIIESRAPEGLVKSNPYTYAANNGAGTPANVSTVLQIRPNLSANGNMIGTTHKYLNNNSTFVNLAASGSTIKMKEQSQNAKFKLNKVSKLTGNYTNSGNANLSTAEYTVYADISKMKTYYNVDTDSKVIDMFNDPVLNAAGVKLNGNKILTISNDEYTVNNKSGLRKVMVKDGNATATELILKPNSSGNMISDVYLPYLPNDTYIIAETKTATGYTLDTTNYPVSFNSVSGAGQTIDVGTSTEQIIYDGFSFYKRDIDTDDRAQGDASLNRIRFAVVNRSTTSMRVHDNMNKQALTDIDYSCLTIMNSTSAGKTPTIEKDQIAAIIRTHDDADGVPGYGAIVGLPYGKYEVYELAADYEPQVGDKYQPEKNHGTNANTSYKFKANSFKIDLTDGLHYSNSINITTATGDTLNANLAKVGQAILKHHKNSYIATNAPLVDGLSFFKKDDYYTVGEKHANANVNGIKFAVINRSNNPVVLHDENNIIQKSYVQISNGRPIANGDIVAIITTHNATIDGKSISGYAAMYGLPYGKYEVVELRKDSTYDVTDTYDTKSIKNGTSIYANDTYLWAKNSHTFTLHDCDAHTSASAAVAAHSAEMLASNKAIIDGFAAYKVDVATGTPQGDASLNGIKFALVNKSSNAVTLDMDDVQKTPGYSSSNIKFTNKKSIGVGNVVAILTSHTYNGKEGYVSIYGLPYGKYELYEINKDSKLAINDKFKATSESKLANDSYLYDGQSLSINLTDNNGSSSHPTTPEACIAKHTFTKAFTNEVVSGNIEINKVDAETGLASNQGINSFAGIKYAVVNTSINAIRYPYNSKNAEDSFAKGQIVKILTLDKNGKASLSNIPYGTYTIYELRMDSTFKAHDVYNASNAKAGTSNYANKYYIYCDSNAKVTLDKNNHNATFDYSVDSETSKVRINGNTYTNIFQDLPVRGDFNTIKVDMNGRYMAKIPFLVSLVKTDSNGNIIFNEETGLPETILEEHIFVSNKNGELDTSDWITRPKTKNNVNKLDGKYNNKGWFTGTNAELTAAQTQNIWFGRISETHDEYVRNGRGSLLYGTYYVQELKTEATKNYDMVNVKVVVNKNGTTVYPVESNVLINIPYFIESIANDNETKSNAMRIGNETATVVDKIIFYNLKKTNRYAYKNKVYRIDEAGKKYLLKTTDLKEIVLNGTDGIIPKTVDTRKITYNASTLQKGEKISIVTELYKTFGKNWVFQFEHNTELDDLNETVVIPKIKTTSVNLATRTRIGSIDPLTIPEDTIEYWNLATNHQYIIDFSIVDDKGNIVKDKNGKNCATNIQFYSDEEATNVTESSRYVIAGEEFIAFKGPNTHGTIKLSDFAKFEVANNYKNIYFVTKIRDAAITGENIIASDNTARDVEDETIRYLQIGTVASSADYLEGIIPNAKVVDLIDKINYENLAENIKVRVDGTVVEKKSKDVVTTASKEFTLNAGKGTKELKFTFDSTPYAGKDLVVFEKIYMVVNGKDVLIANHSDINDSKQTVSVPNIKTNLVNVHKGTGYKVTSQVVEDITLEDTVKYTNVLPGKKWTLTATLMDKNTNKPVKDANGENVTGKVTFTPTEKNGEVVVPITFKQVLTSQNWELDESWVCFESMKSGETGHDKFEYAVHNDINDKDQTVYKPKFRTTATAENGSKQILAKPNQKIVDKVELKNFDKAVKTGDTFTLLIEAMDAKTGKKLLKANGTPYTNTKTFVWNGQTEENIDIVIDASKLEGKVITFFETLYFGNKVAEGSEVLREDAIDNAEQSITVPMVRTTAVDSETRTKTVSLKRILVDKISLTNITPDTDYVIYTKLVDKETGEFIKTTDGEDLVVRSTYHSPKDSKGAIACDGCSMHTDRKVIAVSDIVNVNIDVSEIKDLEGKDLVVYEYLRLVTTNGEETSEEEYSNHEDINDKGQTVEVPKIGTTATSVDTKEHVVPVNEEIELVDTVAYENLIVGETYTIRGKLYNKETNKPITIDDKEITAEKEFTAETESGKVDITFKFNSKILEGTTLVAFEDCSWNNIDIATHADIEDEGQTVDIPKLKTTFFDVVNNKSIKENTENSARIGKDVTLVDIVNYTNLTPGLEYTVTGTIMDKATGEALTIDGKEITASTTFTPENKTGSVEVTFEHIDTSALAGKTVVAFEDLDYNGIDITIHANLEDKDQTIKFPEIHTELIDDKTNDHMVSEGEVTVTDIISYKNLVPGKTYKLIGSLVFATENNLLPKVSDNPPVRPEEDTTNDIVENTNNTEEDTTDVEPIVVPKVYNYEYETAPEAVMYNDQPVTGELEFVASETGEGEVKIQFTFDSSIIKNRTIVAFEALMQDETVLLVDNDIRNEDETVHVPEIHTTAKDKVDNDNVIDGTKTEQTIVDTVTYKNLVPGKTYKVTGKLVVKKDYKEGEDFEYVTDKDGKIVTSVVEFTAEDYNGTVDVEFTIDASKYAGKKLVAFESVSYEDVEFATHADIEDKEQTIEVSLLLHVKVAKVDADNIKYTLKGAEITIFNKDGTIAKDIDGKDCVGITDANGEVDFTVLYREDNTYYAQETKAPAGYNINNDKFEIVATDERESEGVCLIPVQIKDKIIIITPQTGDNIPVMPIAISFGGGLACLAVFFLTRKKKSEMVEVKREEDTDK